MTGGRLKRLKKYLGSDTFMMTYGDGLSDVNLKTLLEFHRKNKKLSVVVRLYTKDRNLKYKHPQISVASFVFSKS